MADKIYTIDSLEWRPDDHHFKTGFMGRKTFMKHTIKYSDILTLFSKNNPFNTGTVREIIESTISN